MAERLKTIIGMIWLTFSADPHLILFGALSLALLLPSGLCSTPRGVARLLGLLKISPLGRGQVAPTPIYGP